MRKTHKLCMLENNCADLYQIEECVITLVQYSGHMHKPHETPLTNHSNQNRLKTRTQRLKSKKWRILQRLSRILEIKLNSGNL